MKLKKTATQKAKRRRVCVNLLRSMRSTWYQLSSSLTAKRAKGHHARSAAPLLILLYIKKRCESSIIIIIIIMLSSFSFPYLIIHTLQHLCDFSIKTKLLEPCLGWSFTSSLLSPNRDGILLPAPPLGMGAGSANAQRHAYTHTHIHIQDTHTFRVNRETATVWQDLD